ncbi:PhnD/SsuA/transferrin family substrate-binding protein [Sphingomonas sp. BK235]|uniref:phosphate/phosphite/phosphonate ABC transporter substrate-binding protein n=1 Tax=Sphingomonas sp. BK235 TaxID=2512131 RepID=UPI0010CEC979|nr:PhnD/SsuA/transferrin family substrate-binding protein [Sphingomonas sp. BK235]TCP35076.1 ABC-type phosphate/phosphonate transport system substrate-binding protein [Sphingomonas sp. BK235]
MIASLAMYDHPAQRWANDVMWRAIAERLDARGIAAPRALERRPVELAWRDPGLLLAQCCGYPLVADPALALRVIARPSYDVSDCAPGQHLSRLIVRADEPATRLDAFRGRIAAINAPLSNTGVNLFRDAVAGVAAGECFFAAVVTTGSHRQSALAVRAGAADIAAIDAVTYAALARYEPEVLRGVRQLGVTRASPALPFVTARATPAATVLALRAALAEVIADPALAPARAALFLRDIVPASVHRYVALRGLAHAAAARGYPALR